VTGGVRGGPGLMWVKKLAESCEVVRPLNMNVWAPEVQQQPDRCSIPPQPPARVRFQRVSPCNAADEAGGSAEI